MKKYYKHDDDFKQWVLKYVVIIIEHAILFMVSGEIKVIVMVSWNHYWYPPYDLQGLLYM